MTTSLLALGSLMEPLRGFVAVGRRMSISAAALELCLSQCASPPKIASSTWRVKELTSQSDTDDVRGPRVGLFDCLVKRLSRSRIRR